MEVTAEILAELVAELEERAEIQQLEAQVKIQQPEKLEVFDSLRLSIVVAAEILAAEVLIKLASETELV